MTYGRTRGYFLPRLGNAIMIIILAVSTYDTILCTTMAQDATEGCDLTCHDGRKRNVSASYTSTYIVSFSIVTL
ncbi:MAG: hypothetical protein K0S84_189 [Nitrososphaera sp.]|jgi:hypothetical protein|nr:hypothetical protein [Nitrososphaera sp.]